MQTQAGNITFEEVQEVQRALLRLAEEVQDCILPLTLLPLEESHRQEESLINLRRRLQEAWDEGDEALRHLLHHVY